MDLVTFTEEILNGKFHFLCSGRSQRTKFGLYFTDSVDIVSGALQFKTNSKIS